MPRDSWFVNRATTQPGPEFFSSVFGAAAAQREALALATSALDFAHRMESAGAWLRLDPEIEPRMFHAATVSEGELVELRRIRNIVRRGRVRAIEAGRVQLEDGEVAAEPDTLYVDCTASAVPRPPPVPVFAGERITLQMIRLPQLPFSAALSAFLEASLTSDDEKNAFVAPIQATDTVSEYIAALVPDIANRQACNRNPLVRAWLNGSRTDGYAKLVNGADPNDPEKQAVLQRLRDASKRAAENLPRLLAILAREVR
jgi:hypothetical protein